MRVSFLVFCTHVFSESGKSQCQRYARLPYANHPRGSLRKTEHKNQRQKSQLGNNHEEVSQHRDPSKSMMGLMRSWNRFIQVSISGGNAILGPRVRPPGTRCQFQRDRADYWGEGCRDRFLHPDQGIHANAVVTNTGYKIQGTGFCEKKIPLNSLSTWCKKIYFLWCYSQNQLSKVRTMTPSLSSLLTSPSRNAFTANLKSASTS